MQVYRGNKGTFRVLQNPVKAGGLVLDPSNTVEKDRVLPVPPQAHQPLHRARERVTTGRKLYTYLHWRGFIVVAKEVEDGSTIDYTDPRLLRRKALSQEAEDIETTWLADGNYTPTSQEHTIMEEYFINTDNLTAFGRYAWFATRFNLYSGKLSNDGLTLRNIQEIQGIPGSGRHVLRVCIYRRQGDTEYPYGMLAEEQLTSGNHRVLLNGYKAASLAGTWTDDGVYMEDTETDPVASSVETTSVWTRKTFKVFDDKHQKEGTDTDLPFLYKDMDALSWRVFLDSGNLTARIKGYLDEGGDDIMGTRFYQSSDGLAWNLSKSRVPTCAAGQSCISRTGTPLTLVIGKRAL